ncbi:MAG: hypothetical protein WCS31_08615 [Verrucomicrobiae bacterium]
MLFALKRLLLLFLLVLAGYCFWPRSPSLSAFDPEKMARLQIAVWKDAAGKKQQEVFWLLYEIYERQYHLPPVSSLVMASDTSRALAIFHTAPDAADQDKALVPLRTVFARLKNATEAKFDANVAAHFELVIWTLRANHAKRAQLTSSWSDLLGVLYGCSAADALPPSKMFAQAAKLADEGKWDEARTTAAEAWTAVKALGLGQP